MPADGYWTVRWWTNASWRILNSELVSKCQLKDTKLWDGEQMPAEGYEIQTWWVNASWRTQNSDPVSQCQLNDARELVKHSYIYLSYPASHTCTFCTVLILKFCRQTGLGKQCRPRSDSLIRFYTVCHSVCIFWTNYSMVKQYCSNFRIVTTNFPVSEFLGFFPVSSLKHSFSVFWDFLYFKITV